MFNRIGGMLSLLLLTTFATVNKAYASGLSAASLSFAEEVLLEAFDEVLDTDEEDFEFFIDGEDSDRHLRRKGPHNYADPVWWRKHKRQYGKHFKRCKFQENVAPVNGTSCPKMRVGDYTCMFEDQICADESVAPAVKCDCLREDMAWQCEKYNACEAATVKECPKQHPVTFNPPLACSGDMSCPIGTERCCGEDFAKYDCTCKDGAFDCKNVNACKGGVCPTTDGVTENQCPTELPQGKCGVQPDIACAYGEICCCDNCVDATTCSCDETSGEWVCASIAFRCQGDCPPEIDGDTCSTENEVKVVGEVECCGSTLPEFECTCSGGNYKCELKNSKNNECICADPEPAAQCPGLATDTPPKLGEQCSAEGLSCSYREICCCNDCVDSTMCTCNNGSWECLEMAFDCMVGTCPPAITGTTRDTEGEVVPEGPEVECCGNSSPQFQCTCSGGIYQCKQQHGPFDECLCAIEPEATCPGLDTDSPPVPGSQCSLPPSETCSYNEICCCNDCVDSTHCSCESGVWQCMMMDFECMQTCPPAMSGTECSVDGESFTDGETPRCGTMVPVWNVTCVEGTYHTKLLNDPMVMHACAAPVP